MNASKVFLRVNRVDAALCATALQVTVSDIHEASVPRGRSGLMSSRMRPQQKGRRIAGPAVTAFCEPGDNLMMHRALHLAQPGDVLVVVCEAETSGAQWGDMAARYALRKGLAGVVVQGCVRDTDAVEALGFPVWATHVHAIHPERSGGGFVNMPVVCDGVRVQPGDLIVADGDGVICVPRHDTPDTLLCAMARMRKEESLIAAIEGGTSTWEFGDSAALFEKMGVQEIDAAFDDA